MTHTGGAPRHRFKQPLDIVDCLEGCLPQADYHLIHPTLESLSERQRAAAGYRNFRWFVVGHRCPWWGSAGELVNLPRALDPVGEPEIRRETVRFVDTAVTPHPERSCQSSGFSPSGAILKG
jgi:hypothetical protein